MDFNNSIQTFLEEQNSSINHFKNNASEIEKICHELISTRDQGKKIFAIGNGGSGSTASHFVSDLLKTAILKNEKRFSAISLTDNIPVILAWSNDVSYDDIFVEQLKNHFSNGDIIIGFSGSGNSQNIIKAMKFGKENDGYCIGFTGESGGQMKDFSDICLKVPNQNMLSIEAQHVLLCHCIISCIRTLGEPEFKYD